jgi:hypothetical protein
MSQSRTTVDMYFSIDFIRVRLDRVESDRCLGATVVGPSIRLLMWVRNKEGNKMRGSEPSTNISLSDSLTCSVNEGIERPDICAAEYALCNSDQFMFHLLDCK